MREITEHLHQVTIVVLGDLMLDRYLVGDVERISPEAPVPVLRWSSERETAGGAGNVALNIASLGAHARLIGIVGDDEEGRRLARILQSAGVASDLVVDTQAPTVSKTRVLAGHQQLLRIDQEIICEPHQQVEAAILAKLSAAISDADALIIADYAKGCLSDSILRKAIALGKQADIPIIVDPKRFDFTAYAGATYIKPNRKELSLATKIDCSIPENIHAASQNVIAITGSNILLTRSEDGMSFYGTDGHDLHLPTEAVEVFDVSGAGDTVAACFTLGIATGATISGAMRFANVAAGIVVGKTGTATVTIAEILAAESAAAPTDTLPRGALASWEGAKAVREQWKSEGLSVGFTNGCFDLLHPGHISLLQGAAAHCDRLIVALNTDASVSRLKGPSRPVQSEAARAEVMGAIKGVDLVVLFDQETPLEIIRLLVPDVLVKGADYAEEAIVGNEIVKAAGGRVERIELRQGQSTTKLIGRANDKSGAKLAVDLN
ncbi:MULTISPECIES: D-glycero-beta-D-manno-heptose-7-phosphate kinase [unclassified Beijerinckia]|uniref:D-glycero-beta-D-manno-heptose-7-phosphate kinase n=1 Tax=unclassified Beijerinckia TaxID=2638183 RepID=UPI000896DC28|nr:MULTISPECIES: D-glycero-beta-D-manno-heptose-7-phosphate kinase [unclassified Beijerinckia]MDH7797808.1 D-beta-D-heptose 7-phosphate kinase/D-beta-D-heptose 1-phosphate adenosyltransferase [Beijerinckia sp. GAS462]SEC99270.1 D-alpha,beta-D-heptose 7-phosphate 1-kinase /D-beta-D-heptose 1-phosphate adenylyltransferase [Beijerinckia sp. 28-YEA-48]